MVTCSIYKNVIRTVTKGYHVRKCCGAFIKARWSKHLGNSAYDCSRVFLLEDHPYRTISYAFNGKPERTQRPNTMTPAYWIRAYDIEKENKFS